MDKPAWTRKVQAGMWRIVSRSATVMAAEQPGDFLPKEEREEVLAAVRYALFHWAPEETKAKFMPQDSEDAEEELP
jgi:hypothetical protein